MFKPYSDNLFDVTVMLSSMTRLSMVSGNSDALSIMREYQSIGDINANTPNSSI